jgi:lipopolysaccharide heptosyltransferase II
VVIDWSMIGDLIMLSPCISALREQYPDGHLALLGQPASIALFRSDPVVDELIPYDRSRGDLNIASFRETLAQLKAGRFDAAFIFHNSFGSALMTWLARIPIRAGMRHEMRDLLLTLRLPKSDDRMHLIEEKARLLELCGIPVNDLAPAIRIDESTARRWLGDKLGPNFGRSRPIVALSIGATVDHKRWPPKLLQQYLNMFPVNCVDIVFLGGPRERGLYEGVYSYNNTVVDLVGQTTMEELAWVIDRCDLYVGPDSGPMHIASARRRPIVALFGPTDPKRSAPLNYEHSVVVRAERICNSCEARFGTQIRQCLHTLMPEEVYYASVEMLKATCPRFNP